jgi:hypothetical protein
MAAARRMGRHAPAGIHPAGALDLPFRWARAFCWRGFDGEGCGRIIITPPPAVLASAPILGWGLGWEGHPNPPPAAAPALAHCSLGGGGWTAPSCPGHLRNPSAAPECVPPPPNPTPKPRACWPLTWQPGALGQKEICARAADAARSSAARSSSPDTQPVAPPAGDSRRRHLGRLGRIVRLGRILRRGVARNLGASRPKQRGGLGWARSSLGWGPRDCGGATTLNLNVERFAVRIWSESDGLE